jgi:hypothetical protein
VTSIRLLAPLLLFVGLACNRQPEDAGSCAEARTRYAAAVAKDDFESARAAINSIQWYCKAPDSETAPMRAAVDARQAELRRQKEEAAKPAMSAGTSASATPDAAADTPLDTSPAAMARVSAAIAQFQQLIRDRRAGGRERNEVCLAKVDARGARLEAIWAKVGGEERFRRKTRWADHAPYLGQTLDDPLTTCLMSCTDDDSPHDGSEADDWGGPAGVLKDCEQASIALSDFAADLKAGRP